MAGGKGVRFRSPSRELKLAAPLAVVLSPMGYREAEVGTGQTAGYESVEGEAEAGDRSVHQKSGVTEP